MVNEDKANFSALSS